MDDAKNVGNTYGLPLGSLFIFNLIVGAGSLSIPQAFAETGLLFGTLVLAFMAAMSFITITYMVEVMSSANGILSVEGKGALHPHEPTRRSLLPAGFSDATNAVEASEQTFQITQRTEMGLMARMFFSKNGVRLFYFCIAVYLYGDLAIYAAAVPKSLGKVACPQPTNGTAPVNGTWVAPDTWDCFGPFNSDSLYRFFVAIFFACMLPFAFTNVQKTKYLQLATSFIRYFSLLSMIIIGLVQVNDSSTPNLPPASEVLDRYDITAVPAMFGVSIYSFMCHHSLPSLVTPIRNKRRLIPLFVFDFTVVLAFYLMLCYSASFRYHHSDIKDVYSLNFNDYSITFFKYFLQLFPVFTLSTSFPVITITLRNNLRTLFEREDGQPYAPWIEKAVFPLVAIIPPVLVALGTDDVSVLVNVTGSYAGLGVQVIIPASLVYFSRKRIAREFGSLKSHPHLSPFGSIRWMIFIATWCVVCVTLVTYNLISSHL
ncbi:transmembrane protein [Capsaspora owczarzaki ATCC 30864]|uniref:Transmembrane protein n=1 Tax=Capsaspora owczarzaki (strain ATCC 30864) TaxID=595528 RepID=A0A0D2VKW7_CAPO3|nr:transmembrane protein [Capsaspora owczarzaki ATCC 30864]KJE90712.1 transmembrane protein [Capsaspora owczarzaki ATCC 30864]|eukprot:XP_004364844.1 transmembrane protein [Capsaspora owczarzaki ATCC 30864]